MRGHAYLTSVVVSLSAGVFFGPGASLAADGRYCVTCTGPDQTYLCRIAGSDVPPNDAMKLYCIVRTAKEGGHASCSAKNDSGNCPGIEKVYAYDGPSLPAPPVQVQGEDIPMNVDEAFEPKTREGAPKTLVEATGRAYSASRRGIRNVRARFGRDGEEEQAALPGGVSHDGLPASSAPHGSLPELPAGSPSPLTPLPSSMTPGSAEEAVPPDEPGRIRRSAQNVGTFAKKSYRCVRSLFFKCRSEQQAIGPE
jgi:hypothetical protein